MKDSIWNPNPPKFVTFGKILAFCWFFCALCAHADTVIMESIEGHSSTHTFSIKIKGDKIRIELFPNVTTILDFSTGEMLSLLHAQKICITSSATNTQYMRDRIRKIKDEAANAETSTANPKLVDTGTPEKVNNFNTEIYRLDAPTRTITLWIAKDIPHCIELAEKLRACDERLGHIATSDTDTVDLKLGIPIKTRINWSGEEVTYTILSIDEKPVDDAEMTAPSGYRHILDTSRHP